MGALADAEVQPGRLYHINPSYVEPLKPVAECVRDYRVLVEGETGGWREVAEVAGNYHRRRVHRFEEVSARRVRIEVLATNGSPSARIYEVRIYREGRGAEPPAEEGGG